VPRDANEIEAVFASAKAHETCRISVSSTTFGKAIAQSPATVRSVEPNSWYGFTVTAALAAEAQTTKAATSSGGLFLNPISTLSFKQISTLRT
jgi:hypothetical protein